MSIVARLPTYAQLTRVDTLDKQVGTLLLLWPTMWGLWIAADGAPQLYLVAVFALGSFLMHSAGCVVNDIADRDFDAHVTRTRQRPLASGVVSAKEALVLAVVLLLAAASLLLVLNALAFWVALVALCLTATYPLTKRFLPIPQAYLGVADGVGIPMTFAAVQNTLPALVWLFVASNVFWVIAFDTIYAMVDREDDLKLSRIRSSAITFGRFEVAAVMGCYGIFLSSMIVGGLLAGCGWVFLAGVGLALMVVVRIFSLIRTREGTRCWRAFVANNWVGVALFLGVALDFYLRGA